MKTNTKLYSLPLLIAVLIILTNSCKKDEDAEIPMLTTTKPYYITCIGVTCGGNVLSDGGSSVINRGVCLSTDSLPTLSDFHSSNGSGMGYFTTNHLDILTPNTTYYVRAYATSEAGTGYGNVFSIKTPGREVLFNPTSNYGSLTDLDNNVYKTITIGNQTWMAENLRVTRYNDTTPILLEADNIEWINCSNFRLPRYCWQNNDAIRYKETYGALYNWFSVETGKLCPSGWHVPSDNEWTILCNNLGGETIAADKLKETGTSHWFETNEATNETGFTAIPAGGRNIYGSFTSIGGFGYWWSSSGSGNGSALKRNMYCNDDGVFSYAIGGGYGFSVRCIKDLP